MVGCAVDVEADRELVEQAMDGGAGYMGNTAPQREQNVRIVYLDPLGGAWASYPRVVVLQAKWDLLPFTEILQPYNIVGSNAPATTTTAQSTGSDSATEGTSSSPPPPRLALPSAVSAAFLSSLTFMLCWC